MGQSCFGFFEPGWVKAQSTLTVGPSGQRKIKERDRSAVRALRQDARKMSWHCHASTGRWHGPLRASARTSLGRDRNTFPRGYEVLDERLLLQKKPVIEWVVTSEAHIVTGKYGDVMDVAP